jgi:uncharacterized membrane protein
MASTPEALMPVAAAKPQVRLRAQVVTEEYVVERKVLMIRANDSVARPEKSLYVTAGAMFAGLVGVFLFAAPGGVIGAAAGALAGLLCAQHRPAA